MENYLVQAVIDDAVSAAVARKLLARAVLYVAPTDTTEVTSREQYKLLAAMAASVAAERRNLIWAVAALIIEAERPDLRVGDDVKVVNDKIITTFKGGETREEELNSPNLERVLRYAVLVHYNDREGRL